MTEFLFQLMLNTCTINKKLNMKCLMPVWHCVIDKGAYDQKFKQAELTVTYCINEKTIHK